MVAIRHPLQMEGRRKLPRNAPATERPFSVFPHPGWCSAPVHPQRVDVTINGNFDTSAERRRSLENGGIAVAGAFVGRK
jgi:hypothetical protein